MSEIEQWLDAEFEHQRKQVAGAIADAILSQQSALVLAGADLFAMADRMVATGVRHGSDWVAVDDAAVLPQWVRQGIDDLSEEVPVLESAGAVPEEGVAQVVSWKDLRL